MGFVLLDQDIENIRLAKLKGLDNLWDEPDLKYLRDKIKDYFLSLPLASCSYCSRSLVGEFKMVIDTEHILPKSKYPDLTYDIQNLNISCRRCNMNYKKSKTDFIVNEPLTSNFFESEHYKFIHPNLDIYSEHLNLIIFQFSSLKYIKYIRVNSSTKGIYTYDYFKLKFLEIKHIDNAQGLQSTISISDKIKGIIREKLIILLTKI